MSTNTYDWPLLVPKTYRKHRLYSTSQAAKVRMQKFTDLQMETPTTNAVDKDARIADSLSRTPLRLIRLGHISVTQSFDHRLSFLKRLAVSFVVFLHRYGNSLTSNSHDSKITASKKSTSSSRNFKEGFSRNCFFLSHLTFPFSLGSMYSVLLFRG